MPLALYNDAITIDKESITLDRLETRRSLVYFIWGGYMKRVWHFSLWEKVFNVDSKGSTSYSRG
jgi:hypothetical protein